MLTVLSLSARVRELVGLRDDIALREIAVISIWYFGDTTTEQIAMRLDDELEALYHRRFSAEIAKDIPIVLRIPEHGLLCKDFILDILSLRHPHSPCYLLYTKGPSIQLTKNINRSASCFFALYGIGDRLTFLRQVELAHISAESGVFYVAPPEFVFALPSSRFSTMFCRAGNIQKEPHILDVLYFWIRPFLKDVQLIVGETWSISTMLYHFASRIRDENAHQPPRVLFLSRYYDETYSATGILESLFHEDITVPWSNVLLVSSVVMTGGSLARLRTDFVTSFGAGAGAVRAVSLFKLSGAADVQSLFDCSSFAERKYVDGAGMRTIYIDPGTYTPTFHEVTTANIMRKHTKVHQQFYERYAGKSIFSVHKTLTSYKFRAGTHQAFFVDFIKLAQTTEFAHAAIKLFKERVSSVHFDLTVTTNTERNREFLRLLRPVISTERELLVNDMSELRRQLEHAAGVQRALIVEAVSSTGGVLGDIQGAFRDHNPSTALTYFVGLARPIHAQEWERRVVRLKAGDHSEQNAIEWVEHVLLPYWDESACPWCKEARVLKGKALAAGGLRRSFLLRRGLKLISDILLGMQEELFLYDGPKSYKEAMTFGGSSVFFDQRKLTDRLGNSARASEADVVCAVASALQVWRSEHKTAALGGTVVNIEELASVVRPTPAGRGKEAVIGDLTTTEATGFNDTILRASLWRCLELSDISPRPSLDATRLTIFLRGLFNPGNRYTRPAPLRYEAILRFADEIAAARHTLELYPDEDRLLSILINREVVQGEMEGEDKKRRRKPQRRPKSSRSSK